MRALSVIAYVTKVICLAAIVPAVALAQPAPGSAGRSAIDAACSDYRPDVPARQRLQDGNRLRLEAAQALMTPGFGARGRVSGLILLADYQEEMERLRPDREAAALYLASASTVPVTLGMLQAVNSTLCVAASPATAQAISTLAEAARVEMAR
jgi:hypothetical protein